jgi:hypothetical protein
LQVFAFASSSPKPSVLLEANTMLVWRLKDLNHVEQICFYHPLCCVYEGNQEDYLLATIEAKLEGLYLSNNQCWNWTLQSLFHQSKILLKTRRRSQRRHGA